MLTCDMHITSHFLIQILVEPRFFEDDKLINYKCDQMPSQAYYKLTMALQNIVEDMSEDF